MTKEKISGQELAMAQQVMFKILCEIDKVFQNNGIRYWLAYGTLLGAVRHKGFVPWDDDIDIHVHDTDYEKAVKALRRELDPQLYGVQFKDNDPQYWPSFARVRSLTTETFLLDVPPPWQILNNRFNGLWVTLFRSRVIKRASALFQFLYIYFLHGYSYNSLTHSPKTDIKADICRVILIGLKAVIWFVNLFPGKSVNFITNYPFFLGRFNNLYYDDAEIFPLGTLEFCGKQFPVPKNFHKVLTEVYGDYMLLPPPDERRTHFADISFLNSGR